MNELEIEYYQEVKRSVNYYIIKNDNIIRLVIP